MRRAGDCFAEGVERRSSDIAEDNADASQRQGPKACGGDGPVMDLRRRNTGTHDDRRPRSLILVPTVSTLSLKACQRLDSASTKTRRDSIALEEGNMVTG